jgi:hypothetical protein
MLRVYLPGLPRADRADAWVRYGSDGRAIDRGRDVPSRWPADAKTEAVLAADQVRLIALALPPMPRERLQRAVRFALEDQIAGSIDDSSVAVGDRQVGKYVAAIASSSTIRAIAGHARRFARVIPEPALAPHAGGWTWCASGTGNGFVRFADGGAFAVGDVAPANDAIPTELAAALAQAARTRSAPAAVHVAFGADAATLASWTQAAGVPFVAAPAWQWDQATPASFAAAPDFVPDKGRAAPASVSLVSRAYRPALLLVALAVAIHLGALAVQWSWLTFDGWRVSRALVDEAKAAQLPNATTPASAFAAIGQRNAALRHRARQTAPADALPLLARAAPALGALPHGALRSARYAGDAWTIDLGKLDPVALSRTTHNLAAAGVDALGAPSASGTRMRLSLAPTAR